MNADSITEKQRMNANLLSCEFIEVQQIKWFGYHMRMIYNQLSKGHTTQKKSGYNNRERTRK